jgi:hypothetical protein
MEHIECSETSAFKTQTPGNYPKETIQHSKHGESLKSRMRVNVTQEWVRKPATLNKNFLNKNVYTFLTLPDIAV